MARHARSWHALLSRQACRRRRRRLQGLPRVTCAGTTSTSGDRGGAETIPFVGIQKCPRTDLLLTLTVLASARPQGKSLMLAHASPRFRRWFDHDESGEPAEPGAVGAEATAARPPNPMNSLSAVVIWAKVDANSGTSALVE